MMVSSILYVYIVVSPCNTERGDCAKWVVTAAFILYFISCCLQLFAARVLEQVV